MQHNTAHQCVGRPPDGAMSRAAQHLLCQTVEQRERSLRPKSEKSRISARALLDGYACFPDVAESGTSGLRPRIVTSYTTSSTCETKFEVNPCWNTWLEKNPDKVESDVLYFLAKGSGMLLNVLHCWSPLHHSGQDFVKSCFMSGRTLILVLTGGQAKSGTLSTQGADEMALMTTMERTRK